MSRDEEVVFMANVVREILQRNEEEEDEEEEDDRKFVRARESLFILLRFSRLTQHRWLSRCSRFLRSVHTS